MEESKTKNIESSIDAFRAIKRFVFQKGAYPKNFDTGFWDEKDFDDPDLRRSIRAEFEEYLELLSVANNKYAKILYDSVPNIESEYNNLVINSRNLDQAVNLFRKKFDEVMFAIEWQIDVNKTLKNYLVPLLSHKIISYEESGVYQDLVCNIGLIHCQSVNAVCEVFEMERPWDKNRPDVIRIEAVHTEATEETASETKDEQPSPTTMPKDESEEKRQIPSEFAEYFSAPFKGIGPGNIDNYSRLVSSLTDAARKRSVIEYAKIALLIYNSNMMIQRKKPNTFSEWYQYFCKIVGCEYNPLYKPSKLKITDNLKLEFNYM